MVYILEPRLDDPRFDGFEAPMELFRSTPGGKRESLYFEVRRLAPNWVVPEVTGVVSSVNHYPCVNLGIPAFSWYAVHCLRDMLVGNGEVLPLRSKCGEFYFYNVTTVADVLDVKNSALSWLKPGIIAGAISYHSFIPTGLDGLTIFRIPQKPSRIYVTQAFVDRALQSRLTGMRFLRVWPVARGGALPVSEVPLPDAGMSVPQALAQSIYLYIASISNTEAELIGEEFRVLLRGRGDHSFSVGHLEYVEALGESWRFAFSCSSAVELSGVIWKYMEDTHRTLPCRIVGRLGRYDDARAKETSRNKTEAASD